MKYALFLFLIFLVLSVKAQKTEAEYSSFYMNQNWTASDLSNGLDTLVKYINFKFVKRFKSIPVREVKATILSMNPDEIKQVNIDGWYNCSKKQQDVYNLWNLYYPRLTNESFEKACIMLCLIMEIDGVLVTKR